MTPEEEAAQKAADEKAAADAKAIADKEAADKEAADRAKDEPKLFTQSEANKWLQDRLADEKRKLSQKAEAEKKIADEAALREKGEFKILADQRESELNEIKPKAELADELTALFNAQIDERIKNWHPEVRELDPGASDVKARMRWLPVGEKIQSRYALLEKNYDTDLGKTGTGGISPKQAVEQSRQSLASSGRY